MMKKAFSRLAWFAVLAVGLAGGLQLWQKTQAPRQQQAGLVAVSHAQQTPEDDAIGVETVRVATRTLSQSVSAVGSLGSQDSVILRPEISGRIAEINFEEGGAVEKGQVLIRLDAAIPQAELARAEAALSLANSHYRRARQLTSKGFVSAQALDETSSQLKVQQAAVALAQAQLDKTVIRAPFDGLIGLRQVSVGDYVSPGNDLAPLESIDPLNVDFRIPEQFLGQVRVGTRIVLGFDALPDVVREGVVGAISPLVDVGGRSILLRAKVPNGDASLRPGMFARVQLQFDSKDALVVPEAAIAPAGDMNYVYRVEAGKAVRVAVGLGLRRDGLVEIVAGLEAGDEVLVSGLQKVHDGAAVRVLQDSDDAAAGS
ncbi:MAG: efflux RND transporter periplasmic adaptor subunit [Castellaniella sp.]